MSWTHAGRSSLPPQYFTLAAFGVAMAYGPVVALILARNSLRALNAAAWQVAWGALIPGFEHANFPFPNRAP